MQQNRGQQRWCAGQRATEEPATTGRAYLKVRSVMPAADKRAARSSGTDPPAASAGAAARTAACVRVGIAAMLEDGPCPAVCTVGLRMRWGHPAAGCPCIASPSACRDAATAAPLWLLLSSSAKTPVAHDAQGLACNSAAAGEADAAGKAVAGAATAAFESAAKGSGCACGRAGAAVAEVHAGAAHSTAAAASSTAASAASDIPKLCHL